MLIILNNLLVQMKKSFTRLAAGLLAAATVAGCQSAPETNATTVATSAAPTSSATAAPEAPVTATLPAETDSLAAVRPFVPAGYQVLDVATGDLNRDAYPDKLVALDTLLVDSLRRESEARRPLLLLTGQPDGTYRLAARNDNAIMCSGCGGMMGDPYQQLVIKNGYFSVEHYGGSNWRWTHILTFKYDAGRPPLAAAPRRRRQFPHRRPGKSENPRRNAPRLRPYSLRELHR